MLKHIVNLSTKTSVYPFDAGMRQPNAVDLRVDRVYRLKPGTLGLDGDTKKPLKRIEIPPEKIYDDSEKLYWDLGPGYYAIEFAQRVVMGPQEAGIAVPRSTLMRNGVLIHSSLYDSGYRGSMVSGMRSSGARGVGSRRRRFIPARRTQCCRLIYPCPRDSARLPNSRPFPCILPPLSGILRLSMN